MPDTNDLLNERGKTHGAFIQNAKVGQAIRRAIRQSISDVGAEVPDRQMEALDYIAGKLSRIVAAPQGWQVEDHWRDIAGYATLALMDDADDYARAGVIMDGEPARGGRTTEEMMADVKARWDAEDKTDPEDGYFAERDNGDGTQDYYFRDEATARAFKEKYACRSEVNRITDGNWRVRQWEDRDCG